MKKILSIIFLAVMTIGLLDSCKKEDSDIAVTGVTLKQAEIIIAVGDPDMKLVAFVAPENASDKTVSWTSNNTDVATIDNQGNLHAVAEGKANITVTTKDGGKTATCAVTVAGASYVEIGGVKWAKMNLGATTEAGSLSTCAGDYYQWGSVNTLYNEIPWNTWNGTDNFLITSWKDGKSSGFVTDNREYTGTASILPDANDVVKQKVGNGWRMPTFDNFKALYDACINGEYDKTTYASTACGNTTNFAKGIYWCGNYDGVAGCLFCDGTNKVFFPAAGQGGNSTTGDGPKTLINPNKLGNYWSSTLANAATGGGVPTSYILNFLSSIARTYEYQGQFGCSIRPVKD